MANGKYQDPKTRKKDTMYQRAMEIGEMARGVNRQIKGIGSAGKASGASVGKRPKNVKLHDIMGRVYPGGYRGLKKKKQ